MPAAAIGALMPWVLGELQDRGFTLVNAMSVGDGPVGNLRDDHLDGAGDTRTRVRGVTSHSGRFTLLTAGFSRVQVRSRFGSEFDVRYARGNFEFERTGREPRTVNSERELNFELSTTNREG